jgi:hypothetical protein
MDATASRPPDLRYSKLHFIPEFAYIYKVIIVFLLIDAYKNGRGNPINST